MEIPVSIFLMKEKTAAIRLLGYSFLILFFELALIRFIPANVRVAAYFINLVLIATFLGMGVGLILHSRRMHLAFLFAPLLLIVMIACWYFSNTIVQVLPSDTEKFFAIYYDISPTARHWGMVPVVSLLFVLTSFVFIPLGLGMGEEFEKFPPLIAYCINIFGSLLGLGAFALLSHFSTPPLVWFFLGMLCFIALGHKKLDLIISLVCFPLIMGLIHLMHNPVSEKWSPYYKINLAAGLGSTVISVNGSLHQYMLNLSDENLAKYPKIIPVLESYLRPYKLVTKLDNVLIVGAGTGNDVVIALKKGAQHIDAVEIDPVILDIGRRMNSHKPYDDPRVSVYNDDARAFLKKSENKYDLIVLGTLDSQTLLSGMSSIRLDNFVYTLEAFRSFKEHLKPDGKLIIYHLSPAGYISYKIYLTLNKAFGAPPLMNHEMPGAFNFTFVAGSDSPPSKDFPAVFKLPETLKEVMEHPIPVDDWPYLYLSHLTIPNHYLWTGGIIAIFSLILTLAALGRENIGKPDGALFFLGAGFLLLETKSVSEMSLLFGSTWQVNVLVFFSILVLILAANVLVLKAPEMKNNLLFILLYALVAISYVIPVHYLLGLSLVNQWIIGGIKVALPLFFAGILFAQILRTRLHPVKSLGYNLIGSILGGLLEYSSMAWGISSLYVISMIMYFMAYFCFNRESKSL